MANSLINIAQRKAAGARHIARKEFYRVCRKTDFTWRYLANLNPWLEYRKLRQPLTAIQQRVLNSLIQDGIAITSVDEFLENPSLYQDLFDAVTERENLKAHEIQLARKKTAEEAETKSYLVNLIDRGHLFHPEDIFIRFAVLPEITAIINGYFGMLTKLFYCNVWHNLPMTGAARESQLWHRDPEDRYILKLFVYMTHVDEHSGATCYAPGTHPRGNVKRKPEQTLCKEGDAYNYRTGDEQMAKVVSREKWITAIGPKRTMLFLDTRGYHKGGLVRRNDRILYNCMYNSIATAYPKSARPKLSHVPKLARSIEFLLAD